MNILEYLLGNAPAVRRQIGLDRRNPYKEQWILRTQMGFDILHDAGIESA